MEMVVWSTAKAVLRNSFHRMMNVLLTVFGLRPTALVSLSIMMKDKVFVNNTRTKIGCQELTVTYTLSKQFEYYVPSL